MDFKNKMKLYMLFFVLMQTVSSQSLSKTSENRIFHRLQRLEKEVLAIRKDLNAENEFFRQDISALSNRLSEFSGHAVRHNKEAVAIAQPGSCDCDAIVNQYKNAMNAFQSEQSENIKNRIQFDEMRKQHDFEIGNLREMLNNVVSGLNSTGMTKRSEIDTIKNETMENAFNREQSIASQYKNVMNAFKSEKSENIMLRQKFDFMRKQHDFELESLREMFNTVVSGLNRTDRTLRSEVDTIKNETKENFSAAQKLVHNSYVVCQKEINDTLAYFNDVMLREKFDEIRKEHDFEIGNVREMFNNAVSILNSTDRTLRLDMDTIKNETKANMSAAHDSYSVCQKEINHTRAYFKNSLMQVNESLTDRSLSASQEISRILSDIVNLKTSDQILKTVTDNLIYIQRIYPPSCDHVEKSGIYKIYPSSHPNGIRVYCYKESTNKGWIVIQRREDGSVDFSRTWADYKAGFGNLSGEFWLGNEHIYQLTKGNPRELRIDMEMFNETKRYALYSKFSILSESENYKLNVAGYSGDAGYTTYPKDSFAWFHNGQSFSTFDADNDLNSGCCACKYGGGGWWYHLGCLNANLNGQYHQRSDTIKEGHGIHWSSVTSWYSTSLKFVAMNIR